MVSTAQAFYIHEPLLHNINLGMEIVCLHVWMGRIILHVCKCLDPCVCVCVCVCAYMYGWEG